MSFLLCFWACLGWVNQINIHWINDLITIKLNEPLAHYEDLPQAILTIDGKEVLNPNLYYEKGVDRTFLSVVNTSLVRSYEIKYRVTFVDYNISQTHVITFDVVDDIAPTILDLKTFEVPVGGSMPNLLEGLRYIDNYDDHTFCTVEVITHGVDLDVIGTYEVSYIISDQSYNQVIGKTSLKVVDYSPPEITLIKPIVIEVSELFLWASYIKIKDNYDDWIEPTIIDDTVDYDQLGQYMIEILAKDHSGNQTRLNTTITIVDTKPPVIQFKSNPKPIAVYDTITRSLLEDYILSIEDNYSQIDIKDVMITHDIDTSRLGAYKLYVTAYDDVGNMAFNTLTIDVLDHEKPEISLKEALIFNVFDARPHLIDYILIEDNYTPFDVLTYTISGTFDMDKVGTYIITVTATDQSKNKTTSYFHLHVMDKKAPTLSLKQALIVTDFLPMHINLYLDYSDNYDSVDDLILTIDQTNINYNHIGIYDVIACVKDLSLNETCEVFEIFITDIMAPTLILKQNHITIDTSVKTIDFKAMILSYEDNYDTISIDDIMIESDIAFGVIGLYKAIYSLYDQSNNQTTETLFVRIDHFEEPNFYTIPLQTSLHERINLEDGLIAEETFLPYEVEIISDHISFDQIGTFEVYYVILDQRGNQTVLKTLLTITKEPDVISLSTYIPLIALNIAGISLLGWLFAKGKHINVFDNDDG